MTKTPQIASGGTPLEVMLDNMRFYHSEAIRLVATLIAGGMPKHLAEDDEAKPFFDTC
jgi:hypothetical protein